MHSYPPCNSSIIILILFLTIPRSNDICTGGAQLFKSYYIYIVTNWNNNVMYVGMTNDLKRRVYEHKHKLGPAKKLPGI